MDKLSFKSLLPTAFNISGDEGCHKQADCPKEIDVLGVAWQNMLVSVNLGDEKKNLLAAIQGGKDLAEKTLTMSLNQVIVMVATKAGWKKPCHMHPSDAYMTVLQGSFKFKLHTLTREHVLKPGDTFLVPKWHPHAEGTHGLQAAVFLVIWSPIPHKANNTIYVSEKECDIDDVPVAKLPSLINRNPDHLRPHLPEEWSATALLHPFSPPQSGTLDTDSLFTQLVVAKLSYSFKQKLFYINVQGCKKGTRWQYIIDNGDTYIWMDEKWTIVDMGWDFPDTDWLGQRAEHVGSSPLNWMKEDKDMAWWKQPHDRSANWFWFDKKGYPFRIMFGVPPPSTSKGDRTKLAFFQMFSFTYIVNFDNVFMANEERFYSLMPEIVGLKCGNPDSFKLFNWTSHFSMSAMMIPVDFKTNPLPTYVYYRWDYGSWSGKRNGRMQTTTMYFTYNTNLEQSVQTAALFGGWSNTPYRSDGYILDKNTKTWTNRCNRLVVDGIVIGQEPPWWPMLGSAQIMAVIRKPARAPADWVSPLTGTNRTVAILGVLFPPHLPQYPDSTYLWTWYDYTEFSEGQGPARPITFMQSASTIGKGTSLALADYFQFHQLGEDVYMNTGYVIDAVKETCNTTLKETNTDTTLQDCGGTGRHQPHPAAFFLSMSIVMVYNC